MARGKDREPWYWKQRGAYYFDGPDGRIRLHEDRGEAYRMWARMTGSAIEIEDLDVGQLYEAYFAFASRQVANGELQSKTLEDYCSYLNLFVERFYATPVVDLAPHHVTDWIAEHSTWGVSSQRAAIKAVKRLTSWATEEGRIKSDPLRSVKKPKAKRREQLVADDHHRAMVLAARSGLARCVIDRQFGLVLIALKHMGGRPQDVANARVEYVHEDPLRWMLPDHKRRATTSQPKVVYLSPCLQTLTRILSTGRDDGPLFRGRRGALTVNAIRCRIKRIKEKLGLPGELIAYSYRHTYITDAIVNGVDTASVAKLAGTSIEMIERNYGHLSQRHDHLQSMAAKATRKKT